jgi:hypothetical protein
MSLSDLASLGSLVSGVAVLISLIYLAIQVRQAERNQRAVLNQGYITRVTEYLRWYAETPMNELRARVMAGDTSFTAQELLQLQIAFRITVLSAQDAYLQHKAGLVDSMTLDNSMRSLKLTWLSYPVYRALWLQQAPTIAPEFASVIEELLRETPLSKPIDPVSRFQADLARISAQTV